MEPVSSFWFSIFAPTDFHFVELKISLLFIIVNQVKVTFPAIYDFISRVHYALKILLVVY